MGGSGDGGALEHLGYKVGGEHEHFCSYSRVHTYVSAFDLIDIFIILAAFSEVGFEFYIEIYMETQQINQVRSETWVEINKRFLYYVWIGVETGWHYSRGVLELGLSL